MRSSAALVALLLLLGCETSEEADLCPDAGSCEAVADVLCPSFDVAVSAPDCASSCDATPCPGPDIAAPPPEDLCEHWAHHDPEQALRSLQRFGLHRAAAVLEGQFGAPEQIQSSDYGPFTIDTVHYGLRFLEGVEVIVPLPAGLPLEAVEGQRWLLGLSNSRPSDWDHSELPYWGNLLAMAPAAERDVLADAVGYRSVQTGFVAVVRIVGQDEYRTTFEVVDALKGTFPATFADNWYASWSLPYPGLAESDDDTWIASVYGLTPYDDPPNGTVYIGSVYDLRRATPEAVDEVKRAIAHPPLAYDGEALRATRLDLADSFRFRMAPLVVSSVVTGFADECCTGAGGTFVQHEVVDVLQGSGGLQGARFVIGGHAYYGGEDCGDGFLQGLPELVDPVALGDEDFDCRTWPDSSGWAAERSQIVSGVDVRRDWSEQNQTQVWSWLDASPPLYQLAPGEAEWATDIPTQDAANAPWSLPLDGLAGFFAATHIALFEIDDVHLDERGFHQVRISTTWSLHEFEHLERYDVSMAFACGDERLLEVGSRWIGGFVLLDDWWAPDEPDLRRGFLVPGALVPEWGLTSQLGSAMSVFVQ